jgi:putative membrane protein
MKSITAFRTFAALCLLILVTACEPNKPKESVAIAKDANDEVIDNRKEEKDADFIVNVMAGNYADVNMAQLALNRSTNADVKKTATMLKAHHTNIITELKGYAAKNGITVPLEESDDAKKEYRKLADEKELDDFNKKWCDQVADKHEKAINYFERRLDKTEDVELKNWITSTLPGLKSHLQLLRANEEGLKKLSEATSKVKVKN